MQKSKSSRVKYAITVIATAAVVVLTPFIGKKCMNEDIHKRIEPEEPKKTLVTENNREERAAKELADLVTAVAPIEENNEKEPEIIDENVKTIIEEYSYEKMNCQRIPITKEMEDEYYKGDFGFWLDSYNKLHTAFKFSREIFMMISEMCGKEITSDNPEALERCHADIPGMNEIGELSDEGKTEQLLSILRHMDSLNIEWEGDSSVPFTQRGRLNLEYALQNAMAESLDGMGYDRKCIAYVAKAMIITDVAIRGLAYSAINGLEDISEIYESIPEIYQESFIEKLSMQILDDVSAEKLEWAIKTLPKEQLDYFYEWVAGYCINKEFRADMESVLNDVKDETNRTKLKDAIREGRNREEESEDEMDFMRMEIELHKIRENTESDFE